MAFGSIFLFDEFSFSWTSAILVNLRVTVSLISIWLVVLLFVESLLDVFLFKRAFFHFNRHFDFLSSTRLSLKLMSRLSVTRLNRLGYLRSSVLVEFVVVASELIKSFFAEKVAVWIYEWSIFVHVEPCLVIFASWRVPLLFLLLLLQVLVNLILVSGVVRCAWSSLLNWTTGLWTRCSSIQLWTSWVVIFWVWVAPCFV